MSNGSPTAYLLWAILSCIFFGFLLGHLWAYDRFNCLKWDAGRQPGTFKRVMTYSYVATLPLLVFFTVAMTALKFKEGFFQAPTGQIIPRPIILWAPDSQHWLLPLYFVLSIAWSLELVTHLEELAFWLFLLHQGPGKHDWFHSWEFRAWYLGSIVAVLGMPLTALLARRDLELIQAWIFLAGSSAGTSTTVCFLYVLARFPWFLRHVKEEGAEPDVVVRLTTFYHLNRSRVIFRFLYTTPLLIIAIDVVCGIHFVVRSSFAFDFLLMTGGVGCFVSSTITLLIFFPQSITCEKAENILYDSTEEPSGTATHTDYHDSHNLSVPKIPYPHEDAVGGHLRSFRFPINRPIPDSVYPTGSRIGSQTRKRRHSAESRTSPGYESDAESIAMPSSSRGMILTRNLSARETGIRSDDTVREGREELSTLPRRQQSSEDQPFSRPRKVEITILSRIPVSEEEVGGRSTGPEQEPATHSQLHPYLINFTSPIDLSDHPLQERRPHAV